MARRTKSQPSVGTSFDDMVSEFACHMSWFQTLKRQLAQNSKGKFVLFYFELCFALKIVFTRTFQLNSNEWRSCGQDAVNH